MMTTARKTVLIAGASGVVGSAALEHFLQLGDWEVAAVSRRSPSSSSTRAYRHICVDLRDADACRSAMTSIGPVTHLVYAALYEKPGLIKGWRERDQMDINLSMLRNLLEPIIKAGKKLEHVSLLQGTKAYGVHLHQIAVPARERWPRDAHESFYWMQEDYLCSRATACDFGVTIFRPQVIFGDVVGVAMNLMPVLGVYAAICRHEARLFSYPGGPPYVLEAVDSRLMARALAWAATSSSARNQTFNITNGDVFVWQNVWAAIADALGVGTGPDIPLSLAEFLPGKAQVWDEIVRKHKLRSPPMRDMLGESHFYADFSFAFRARTPPPPAIVSTIKLRQAGFADCIDTEEMFRDLSRTLIDRRILPPRDA